jgi:hypothetical protein
MHDTLGYPFVIKVVNLFAQNKVFKKYRTRTIRSLCLKRVFIVRDRDTLLGSHARMRSVGELVELTSIAYRLVPPTQDFLSTYFLISCRLLSQLQSGCVSPDQAFRQLVIVRSVMPASGEAFSFITYMSGSCHSS